MDAKDAGPEIVTVTEQDLSSHDPGPLETTEVVDVLVDPVKNIWVTEGIPVEDLNVPIPQIRFPDKPHVFKAHELRVNDRSHKDFILHDVIVLAAHGYRENNLWKFVNGQSVSDTVEAYNLRAEREGTPKIEFVLSCNKDNTPDPLGIKIKDISERHIAQAIGEETHIGLRDFSKWGRVSMSVSVDGEFWGLDDLVTFRRTEILPDVDQAAPE